MSTTRASEFLASARVTGEGVGGTSEPVSSSPLQTSLAHRHTNTHTQARKPVGGTYSQLRGAWHHCPTNGKTSGRGCVWSCLTAPLLVGSWQCASADGVTFVALVTGASPETSS